MSGPKNLTPKQRKIFEVLAGGGRMGVCGKKYAVWTAHYRPVHRFTKTAFIQLSQYCRQGKNGIVICRKKINRLRPNVWAKRFINDQKNKA
jgi:hypothetical protein